MTFDQPLWFLSSGAMRGEIRHHASYDADSLAFFCTLSKMDVCGRCFFLKELDMELDMELVWKSESVLYPNQFHISSCKHVNMTQMKLQTTAVRYFGTVVLWTGATI